MAKASPRRSAPAPVTTPARRGVIDISKPVKPTMVEFVEPDPSTLRSRGNIREVEMPDEWADDKATVAESGLMTPAADWKAVGEYAEGEYLGFTADVGPNKSKLYHFRAGDESFSVWGSTVIDDRMEQLNPPKGSLVRITFVGTSEPKKGQNPAKVFDVRYR